MLRLHIDSKFYIILDWYGVFVARNPWKTIVFSLLVCLGFSFGCLKFNMISDPEILYTPTNAPARWEKLQRHMYFYPNSTNFSKNANEFVYIMLVAFEAVAEDFNLLDEHGSRKVLDVVDFIFQDLNYTMDGVQFNFGKALCSLAYCRAATDQLKFFYELFFNRKLWEECEATSFGYPFLQIQGEEIFVGEFIRGVETDPETGEMLSAKLLLLPLVITDENNATAYRHVPHFEEQFIAFLQDYNRRNTGLRLLALTNHQLQIEFNRIIVVALPYLLVTALTMISFAVLSNINLCDCVRSKCWEALAGIVSTAMAIPPSCGLLFVLGVPFNSAVVLMPFLIFGIGIDDMFILMHAWRQTPLESGVERRLAKTMREAGAAIFVTSLTNAASFGIGAFSPTPAMSDFCTFLAVGTCFDFFMQITFFPAILALGGRREERRMHGICCCIQAKTKSSKTSCLSLERLKEGVLSLYMKPVFKMAAIFFYSIYLLFALIGCSRIYINLQTDKLLLDDSPLVEYFKLFEKYVWKESTGAEIFILKAPDFRLPNVSETFMNTIIFDLEHTDYSIGERGTTLWLREFLKYREYFAFPAEKFYFKLQFFLKFSSHDENRHFIKWRDDESVLGGQIVDRFHFKTYFENTGSWRDRIQLQNRLRQIAGNYSDLYSPVTILNDNYFIDQVATLGEATMQTMGIALLAMAQVALVFFPSLVAAFWVFFTLISIDAGVVGFLVFWGVELDPMTSVCIVMSIGFSIDFTAHFCFQFYRQDNALKKEDDRQQEVGVEVIRRMGWPLMQCGLSSALAVLCVCGVQANIVRVFFRTVFLVILLGLVHALLLLPIVLPNVRGNPIRTKKTLD